MLTRREKRVAVAVCKVALLVTAGAVLFAPKFDTGTSADGLLAGALVVSTATVS